MKNINDLLGERAASIPSSGTIDRIHIGKDRQYLSLFSAKYDTVKLHYESSPEYSGYFQCPGEDCPYCHLNKAPAEKILFPVLDVETESVKILPLSNERGPGKLLTQLIPTLRRPDLSSVILGVTKRGYDYHTEIFENQKHSDDALAAIEQFLQLQETSSIDITSIFARVTVEELLERPVIDRLLKAHSGLGKAGS